MLAKTNEGENKQVQVRYAIPYKRHDTALPSSLCCTSAMHASCTWPCQGHEVDAAHLAVPCPARGILVHDHQCLQNITVQVSRSALLVVRYASRDRCCCCWRCLHLLKAMRPTFAAAAYILIGWPACLPIRRTRAPRPSLTCESMGTHAPVYCPAVPQG